MSVNLLALEAHSLLPVPGVELGIAKAHISKPDLNDMLLIRLAAGVRAAGVFTKNRFCAAPVTVWKEDVANTGGDIRALVFNTGNASAGTGETGFENARATSPWTVC